MLGAEALHEVTHILSFLRLLTQQPSELAAAELQHFAQGELERMQRLAAHLRRFKLPAPQNEEVHLVQVIAQCVERVRDVLEAHGLHVEVEIPAEVAVQTDAPCLVAALCGLLLELLEEAPAGCVVRIAVTSSAQTVQLELSIECAGSAERARSELRWWELWPLETPSSRRLLAGKRLRHLGWSLTEEHSSTRTLLRLTAPSRSLKP
ncbi:MAG: hypothetical protein U1A78_37805 [Polyangia bacterium]